MDCEKCTYLTVEEEKNQVLFNAKGVYNRIYKYDLTEHTVEESQIRNFYLQDHFTGPTGDIYVIGNDYYQPEMQMYQLTAGDQGQ